MSEREDIRYELIPYDGFIGSQEFDFDKTIYDLNSQIELLSSHADNLDYVVAIASGIACGLLDILWVGEFDLAGGRSIASDKVDSFVKRQQRCWNVDIEKMEKDFTKLLTFWKSIYLRKE